MEERLQKLLSTAGICSRRTAENYIKAGRVTVNGVIAQLGQRADINQDDIRLDGRPVGTPEERVYLILNKPRGFVTTLSDEQGRKTVADLVSDIKTRVYPVGRLDINSEGLLLMTNDGALAQRILHPRYAVSKTYRVWIRKPETSPDYPDSITMMMIERLSAIRDLDGEKIQPVEIRLIQEQKNLIELELILHEGRNRQIRRMCAQCGFIITRLRRIREENLELGNLPPGKWRYLTDAEKQMLYHAVFPSEVE